MERFISLLRPYIALWGGYGFYRGYTATNRCCYGKEDVTVDDLLVVEKLSNGVTNSFMYVTLPVIPLYKMIGRFEIDRDPTRNKYSSDHISYYKEFTFLTRLPPRSA